MRKIMILLLMLLPILVFAEIIKFDENYNKEMFEIHDQNSSYIDLSFNLDYLEMSTTGLNGKNYTQFHHEEAGFTLDEGNPELPFFSTYIAIPNTGSAELEVKSVIQESRTLTSNPLPYFEITSNEKDRIIASAEEFYSTSVVYPVDNVVVGSPVIIRDLRVIPLTVYPVSFNTENKGLSISKSVDIRVNFNSRSGENEILYPRKRSKSFENTYRSLVANYEQSRDEDIEYQDRSILIVYNSSVNIQSKLDEFVAWKKNKGFQVTVADPNLIGTSNGSVKTYIQNVYDYGEHRPEYIILIGDVSGQISVPTWFDGYDGYDGAGDYKYTQLEGNDILPDAFIGRISVSSSTEFKTVINKIIGYEKNTNLTYTDWYNSSVLVGDSSTSGISCVYSSEYVKEKMLNFNPDFQFHNYETLNGNLGWNTANDINNAINAGSLFYFYRGYIGMSGWDESDANSLSNTGMLTNAVIVTCATNSFDASETRAEALLRHGTPSEGKGGVSAIGMSTIHTNTRCNNILNASIAHGVYSLGMQTMGEAANWARYNLYQIYYHSHQDMTNAFCQWMNLMGDPSMNVWREKPKEINVIYDETVSSGTNQISVIVNEINNSPLEDAWVTLRSAEDDVFVSAYTNAQGEATLYIDPDNNEDLFFTVSKLDYIPLHDTLAVSGEVLGFVNAQIDDDDSGTSAGNNNGQLNPGETIEMKINIHNYLANAVTDVSGVINTEDPYVNITSGSLNFGTLNSDEEAQSTDSVVFEINSDIPDNHKIIFDLMLNDNQYGPWQTNFCLVANSSDLDIVSAIIFAGGDDILDPGETGSLKFEVENNGLVNATDIFATISSDFLHFTIEDNEAEFGEITAGNSGICENNTFEVTAGSALIPGMMIPLEVTFTNSEGYEEIELFNLEIGEQELDDPLGPDEYGYFCFDDGDIDYVDCPVYEWIEIATDEGGEGSQLNIQDEGSSWDEGDQVGCNAVETIDLPFEFIFYGEVYTRISVSSNGFIAFEETENGAFRNSYIPAPMGPSPIIAAFWDDLCTNSGGKIFTYHDQVNQLFIIEWYEMKNGSNQSSEETFQIILYDPFVYPTNGNNGMIKIQYKVFNNVDQNGYGIHGNYSTIGIENDDETVGIQYTFNNQYPTAAKELSDETAILFTTGQVSHEDAYLLLGEFYLHDENDNNYLNPGENVNLGISLVNFGLSSAENTSVTISSSDPMITITNNTSDYPVIESGLSATNNAYFSFDIDENCGDDYDFTIVVNVQNDTQTWEYNLGLTVFKPSLEIKEILILDNEGNANSIADPGETVLIGINLANESFGVLNNVQLQISSDITGINVLTEQVDILKIPEQKIYQAVFEVEITESVQEGDFIDMSLSINSDELDEVEQEFSFIISSVSYFWDFEEDGGDFVSHDGWELGQSPFGAHSGANVWGTDFDNQYPPNIDWWLDSPEILISENTMLTFYHYCRFEQNWDGGQVRISTNGGNSFDLLYPVGGYDHNELQGLDDEPGYSHDSSSWEFAAFDLSEYAGMDVILRWRLGSDGLYQDDGWFIDDISVSAERASNTGFEGTIVLDGGESNVNETTLTIDGINITPNINGDYQIIKEASSYDMFAFLNGYSIYTEENLIGTAGELISVPDITLYHLNAPENLEYSVDDFSVELTWEIPISREKNERDLIYRIYRKDGTAEFVKIDSTEGFSFTETLNNGNYSYYITAKYDEGESISSNIIDVNVNVVDNENNEVVQFENKLYGNYPNPFNPETRIHFSMKNNSSVSLKIYNIKGQLVKDLVNSEMEAGNHKILWNGTDNSNKNVSTGVYFYRIETNEFNEVRKALLLK